MSNKLKISYLFTNPAAALLKDISRLKKQPLSDERNEMLKVKLAHLISLQKHEVLGNKKRSSDTTGKEARNLHIQRHEKMRYMFYSKDNSKNRFLFADFFDGINPIDILEWKLSGWFFRTVNILYSPIMLFIKLMIPQINRESPKHGWCKLLNCLQIVIIPFVTICAVHCKLNNRFHAKIVIAFMSLFSCNQKGTSRLVYRPQHQLRKMVVIYNVAFGIIRFPQFPHRFATKLSYRKCLNNIYSNI